MSKTSPPKEPSNAMASLAAPTSKTQAMKAMRARMAERPDTQTLWNTIRDFGNSDPDPRQNDRSAALVLGAILEQSLETAILTHCVEMSEGDRTHLWGGGAEDAVISFSAKIRLGYALGIYGPNSKADLDNIRHIRNLFAHTKTLLRFSSSEIRGLCFQMNWLGEVYWGGLVGTRPSTGRKIFLETIRHFFLYFETAESGRPLRYPEEPMKEAYS